MLEGVTIAKVDMSPSGASYRLWRASQSKRHSEAHPFVLIGEVHRNHIFDDKGRYILNDVIDESLTPDA
jgi:hypothetical protein